MWDDDLAEFGFQTNSFQHQNDTDEKYQQIEECKKACHQLDLDPEEWNVKMYQLYQLSPGTAMEIISDFCSRYQECHVESLRVACEYISRSEYLDFLTRIKTAEVLGNDYYILEVLDSYRFNAKEDVNFILYAEHIERMLINKYIPTETLEPHLLFLSNIKLLVWNNKFKLFKTLTDYRADALKTIASMAKLLVTNNILSSFTILVMQLYKFDQKTISSILLRSKGIKDVNFKADLYDHLLDYPAFKDEAFTLLKSLGQNFRALDSSQNVHMVTADIEAWLQQMYEIKVDTKTKIGTFKECKEYLLQSFEAISSLEEFLKIEYSLQRLEFDNSVYGKMYMKLSACLLKVVTKILQHSESQEELIKRLKEELIEMSSTCSRGHLYRLMNVFSGFDGENSFITVDPTVELKSVINKRVELYMASLIGKYEKKPMKCVVQIGDDEDTRFETTATEEQLQSEQFKHLRVVEILESDEKVEESSREDIHDMVMDAWMNGDQAVLQKHLYSHLSIIHDELLQDYVGQNIMSEQDFTLAYRDITNNLFS
jgi:hypothetical protein